METVVIATYNEELSIDLLLVNLVGFYDNIVVVDDSTDRTPEIIKKFDVKYICGANMGIAHAYLTGFTYARSVYPDSKVIQMDAGLTHNPWDIPELLKRDCDLVIGSREFEWKGIRTGISKTASFMMNLGIEDVTSGFRIWSPELMKQLDFNKVIAKGFAFQLELLYQAYKLGASIEEVKIPYILTNSSFKPKMLLEALYVYMYQGMWKK